MAKLQWTRAGGGAGGSVKDAKNSRAGQGREERGVEQRLRQRRQCADGNWMSMGIFKLVGGKLSVVDGQRVSK